MARPKRTLPKPTLHKASGLARVYINGRYIYLGKWGSPEADEELRKIILELESVPQSKRHSVKRLYHFRSDLFNDLVLHLLHPMSSGQQPVIFYPSCHTRDTALRRLQNIADTFRPHESGQVPRF
ncbi:MAG: hypothetical protein FWH27_17185 [Planctomycetaceae bacterium]|nr:hypothetical protein [Planctomycetaceae bacterium]